MVGNKLKNLIMKNNFERKIFVVTFVLSLVTITYFNSYYRIEITDFSKIETKEYKYVNKYISDEVISINLNINKDLVDNCKKERESFPEFMGDLRVFFDLYRKAINCCNQKELIRDLLSKIKTNLEKPADRAELLYSILYFVHSLGENDSIINKQNNNLFFNAEFLYHGYGDCDTKTCLAASLLEEAKIDAIIVNVSQFQGPGHSVIGISGFKPYIPYRHCIKIKSKYYYLVELRKNSDAAPIAPILGYYYGDRKFTRLMGIFYPYYLNLEGQKLM